MERIILAAIVVAALALGSVTGYFVGDRNGSAGVQGTQFSALQEVPPVQPVAMVPPGMLNTGAPDHSQSAGSLEEIFKDTLGSRRRLAIQRYCARLDAAGVRDALQSLPKDGSDQALEAEHALIARWAELDPAAAVQFALNLTDQRFRTNALISVFDVWGYHDANAAAKFLLSRPVSEELSFALHYFTAALAARDPAHALRLVDEVQTALKPGVVWTTFQIMSENDPVSAAAQATGMPAGPLRDQAMKAVVARWVEDSPAAAVAWVEKLKAQDREQLLDETLRGWATADPEAAAKYVQKLPEGGQRAALIERIASDWSFRDVEPAMKWVQSLPEGSAKEQAAERAISSWASKDPLKAADFIARQSPGGSTARMLEELGSTWSRNDPEGALEWALAHPGGDVEKHVMAAALGRVAAEDPARAVAALEHLQSPESRSRATKEIAFSWIRTNPQDAMRWAMGLPDSSVATETIGRWTSRDPGAVGTWLNTLENDARRESFVAAYARKLQYQDAEGAASWANTLTDTKVRQPLVRTIVREMAQYDPAGASQWIEAHNFEAAERKSLMDQVESARRSK